MMLLVESVGSFLGSVLISYVLLGLVLPRLTAALMATYVCVLVMKLRRDVRRLQKKINYHRDNLEA